MSNKISTTQNKLVYRGGVDETWGTIRDGAGTGATYDSGCGFNCSTTNGQFADLLRSIITFDTSDIGNRKISSASVKLEDYNNLGSYAGTTPNIGIAVYGATPSDPESIVAADYGNCGTTILSDIVRRDTIVAQELLQHGIFLELDKTGIDYINTSGYTSFSLRDPIYDVAGSVPSWESERASYIVDLSACTVYLLVSYTESESEIKDSSIIKRKVTLEAARNLEVQFGGRIYISKSGNFTYESRFHRQSEDL